MLNFENQVQSALKADETVFYRATPIYKGTNARPIGIELFAQSHGPNAIDIHVTILNR